MSAIGTRGHSRRHFVTAATATFGAVCAIKAPAKAAQFEFKMGTETPVNHPMTTRLAQLCGSIEQESDGRLRIQQFPNSLLGSGPAMLSQLRIGAMDFQHVSAFVLGDVAQAAGIGSLGFTFRDANDGIRVMGTGGALSDYIQKDIAAKGIYAFKVLWSGGMFDVTSGTHPIRTPDDFHGFKIRVQQSKIAVDLFKELGANPTSISAAELYTALQTKLVDGNTNALGGVEGYKLYEVQKYISLTNHGWAPLWLIVNADTWNKLPADLQNIVDRNNRKYAALVNNDMRLLDQSVLQRLAQKGMTVNPVDQTLFVSALRNYYKAWADVFGPTEWSLLQSALGRRLF